MAAQTSAVRNGWSTTKQPTISITSTASVSAWSMRAGGNGTSARDRGRAPRHVVLDAEHRVDAPAQLRDVHRLDEVAVEARRVGLLGIAGLPVAGPRYEARVRELAMRAHAARELVPGHARQPDVEQHDVGTLGDRPRERRIGIVR